LFTSSGDLANQLMHPRFGLEREYAVRVLGSLSRDEKHLLLDGVRLDDGVAQFGTIQDGGGEGSNCWYRVTISEGRNREVRRMIEAVGHAVSRLIRIRYGAMLLPRGLKRGAWMELEESDIRALTQAAGAAGAPGQAALGRPERAGPGTSDRAKPRGPGSSRGPRSGRAPIPSNKKFASPMGGARTAGPKAPAGQPDPLKTSVGYIGADSLTRQRKQQGGKPGAMPFGPRGKGRPR